MPKPGQNRDAPEPAAKVRQGVVTAVNIGGSRIEIGGAWYAVVPGRTKLVRAGQPLGIEAVKKGQSVTFTVLAQARGVAALGVVHVPQ